MARKKTATRKKPFKGWLKEKVISTSPVTKKPDRYSKIFKKKKLANAFEAQTNYRSKHGGLYIRKYHLQHYRKRDQTQKYPTGLNY